jgi:hypothetical protein
MRPFGQIALDQELCLVDMGVKLLSKFPKQVREGPRHVDGIYFKVIGFEYNRVEEAVQALVYPSGKPKFHIKTEPSTKLPTWEANWLPGLTEREPHRSFNMPNPKKTWKTVVETEYRRM